MNVLLRAMLDELNQRWQDRIDDHFSECTQCVPGVYTCEIGKRILDDWQNEYVALMEQK